MEAPKTPEDIIRSQFTEARQLADSREFDKAYDVLKGIDFAQVKDKIARQQLEMRKDHAWKYVSDKMAEQRHSGNDKGNE